MNIVLIGFMGAGKTSVGRLLAANLGMRFVDMDEIIERRQGRPIAEIFARDGEAFFRGLERELVRELAGLSGLVIATGGGVVLNADNVRDFERTGLAVCLRATPETILARVGHETHRPLLAVDDKLGRIRSILAARGPKYDAVAHQVVTDGRTPAAIAAEIEALYRRRLESAVPAEKEDGPRPVQ